MKSSPSVNNVVDCARISVCILIYKQGYFITGVLSTASAVLYITILLRASLPTVLYLHAQGGHKPGILRDFSEHGKLMDFSGNSVQSQGKIVTRIILVRHSYFKYLCKTAVNWVNRIIRISGSNDPANKCRVDVEWPLMKIIITFSLCCDNLWKSKFMALEKPGKLWGIFSPTLWPPWCSVST